MGDSSCFLFNLTLNLRFNARISDKIKNYQSATTDEIRFGNNDLVMKENFKDVKSKIAVPNF